MLLDAMPLQLRLLQNVGRNTVGLSAVTMCQNDGAGNDGYVFEQNPSRHRHRRISHSDDVAERDSDGMEA